jgi:hypothetical protein
MSKILESLSKIAHTHHEEMAKEVVQLENLLSSQQLDGMESMQVIRFLNTMKEVRNQFISFIFFQKHLEYEDPEESIDRTATAGDVHLQTPGAVPRRLG